MITLNLKQDHYWMNLQEGVRLYVRPLSTAIMLGAQQCVIKELAALKLEAPEIAERPGMFESLLIRALARQAIIKWEGVFELDSDKVAPVTDKTVNNLMDIWFLAQDFWRQYTSQHSILEEEGKLSGLAQSGTTVAGPNTAAGAKRKGFHAAKAKRIR